MSNVVVFIIGDDDVERCIDATPTSFTGMYMVQSIPSVYWGEGNVKIGDVIFAPMHPVMEVPVYEKTCTRAVFHIECECGSTYVGYLNQPSLCCRCCGKRVPQSEYRMQMRRM